MRNMLLVTMGLMLFSGQAMSQSAFRSSYSHSAFSGSAYAQPSRQQSFTGSSYSQPVHVGGYVKSDGTYVQPYYRTSPDETRSNNYSTSGNINPYTGEAGTRSPDDYGY